MPSEAHGIEADEIVTSEDVANVARQVTNDPSVTVVDYRLEAYSASRVGWLGSHRQLKIKIQRKDAVDSVETITLFVKSVPHDLKAQKELLESDKIFEKEMSFFKTIIPFLVKNYEEEKWHPTCYLAKSDVLIMEDLRTRGYKMMNKFYDRIEMLKSGCRTLARFHSCSILAENRLNENSEKPVTIADKFPTLLREVTFNSTVKSHRWVVGSFKVSAAIAECLGYDPRKIHEVCERIYQLLKPSEIHRNVVCHGDLWANNLMFDESLPTPNSVLVDFQIVRYGPMVLDLLQFIYLNTTRSFRDEFEKDLIEYYHSILEKTVADNDCTKCAKVPTLEEVFIAYNDLRLFGVILASMYLPLLLIDPSIATETTSDVDGYESFLFGDRTKFTLDHMEKDAFYKGRLEKIITELAEIGLQQ